MFKGKMNAEEVKSITNYLVGKIAAYMHGLISIGSVAASVKSTNAEFFSEQNVKAVLKGVQENAKNISRNPNFKIAYAYDSAVLPLVSRMVYFTRGEMQFSTLRDFAKGLPQDFFLKEENLSATIELFCNELYSSKNVQTQAPAAQPAQEVFSAEKAKEEVLAGMLGCAKQYKKIQAAFNKENSPASAEGYKICAQLKAQLQALPAEFFTSENVHDLHTKYYDTIIDLTTLEPLPNEGLAEFRRRGKEQSTILKQKGGFYDVVDAIATALFDVAHQKNGEIETAFYGIVDDTPINFSDLYDGDGK